MYGQMDPIHVFDGCFEDFSKIQFFCVRYSCPNILMKICEELHRDLWLASRVLWFLMIFHGFFSYRKMLLIIATMDTHCNFAKNIRMTKVEPHWIL
jgi:hypothetical protein